MVGINQYTKRFLLILYHLGIPIDNLSQYCISGKTRFIKLCYLADRPSVLENLMNILHISSDNSQIIQIQPQSDTFFIFYFGAFLKDFPKKIAEAISLKYILKKKISKTHIYYLTPDGIALTKTINDCQTDAEKPLKEILLKMEPVKKVSTTVLIKTINIIIKKSERSIGERV